MRLEPVDNEKSARETRPLVKTVTMQSIRAAPRDRRLKIRLRKPFIPNATPGKIDPSTLFVPYIGVGQPIVYAGGILINRAAGISINICLNPSQVYAES